MKVSYNWLNKRFLDKDLPSPEIIARELTMKSFEVDSVDEVIWNGGTDSDTILDIKILPDRSHDCLSHKGIAKELAIILDKKTNYQPEKPKTSNKLKTSDLVSVSLDVPGLCHRINKRVMMGVRVGPSPKWLSDYLIAIGSRSVNNVVDATNFVMFETGQPIHAFDLDKISDSKKITLRRAKPNEEIICLDEKIYVLDPSVMVWSDEKQALDIAGIKGGLNSGIDDKTSNIILSACNFDSISIRLTAKKLGLRTDASVRFENKISPEITHDAIDLVSAIIQMVAGGEVAEDILDIYPRPQKPYVVGVSVEEVENLLGINMDEKTISALFSKAGFEHKLIEPLSDILERAKKLIGRPYKWGASVVADAPNCFDCSSFVSYLFAQAGIAVPRMSVDQFVFGKPVELSDIQLGDLLFFNNCSKNVHLSSVEWFSGIPVPKGVDHVAFFVGGGKMIHASGGEAKVVEEDLQSSFLYKNCVGVRRISTLAGKNNKRFVVTIPDERLDIRRSADLIEEVARLVGYESIKDKKLDPPEDLPETYPTYSYIENLKSFLANEGFSEIYTYAFVSSGEVEVQNPIASDKKYLRPNLSKAMIGSIERNAINSELLGLDQIKVFEIGKIFSKDSEKFSLAIGANIARRLKKEKIEHELLETLLRIVPESSHGNIKKNMVITRENDVVVLEIDLDRIFSFYSKIPNIDQQNKKPFGETLCTMSTNRFQKISLYPFIVRDIAVFVPQATSEKSLLKIILKEAGPLVVRCRLFDKFEKIFPDGSTKVSYAFRLVFQSSERTLNDEEVNSFMVKVTKALSFNSSWQVR